MVKKARKSKKEDCTGCLGCTCVLCAEHSDCIGPEHGCICDECQFRRGF